MRRHLTIGLLAAAPALAASIAHSQVAAPAFDANAAAAIQELATKAASQGITLVPQPEGPSRGWRPFPVVSQAKDGPRAAVPV